MGGSFFLGVGDVVVLEGTRALQFLLFLKLKIAAKDQLPAPPVSLFTTEIRKDWAHHRTLLKSLSPTNAKSLERVESALFTISFDGEYAKLQSKVSVLLLF